MGRRHASALESRVQPGRRIPLLPDAMQPTAHPSTPSSTVSAPDAEKPALGITSASTCASMKRSSLGRPKSIPAAVARPEWQALELLSALSDDTDPEASEDEQFEMMRRFERKPPTLRVLKRRIQRSWLPM